MHTGRHLKCQLILLDFNHNCNMQTDQTADLKLYKNPLIERGISASSEMDIVTDRATVISKMLGSLLQLHGGIHQVLKLRIQPSGLLL